MYFCIFLRLIFSHCYKIKCTMWQIAIIVTVTVVYSIIIVEINYMIVPQRTGTYQSGTFLVGTFFRKEIYPRNYAIGMIYRCFFG